MTEDTAERLLFFEAWEKSQTRQKLNPLEKMIVKTVKSHSEFQHVLQDRETYLNYEFPTGETDPFAHMALHLMMAEMISSNNPPGLRALYDATVRIRSDKHEVQHQFIEALFDWYVMMERTESEHEEDLDFLKHIERHVGGQRPS